MGMKFFYLQLTIFFILTTDSIIISHLIDNTAVSYYDILFKYFGILMIIHSIVNTPLWTMYTEAYLKKDKEWLIYTLKKMSILTFFYGLVGLIMILFASKLIPLWINENNLDLKLSNYIFMLLLTITLIWYSIFAYFTNGINKTKNQLISSFIGAVVHIPLAIYFVKELSMGLNGVMLSTIISLSIFGITGPIQAYLELRKLSNEHIL
jgi:Na+-driven multidrug efflux pump